METERRLRPAVADAIRIIAMTGARRGEITGLRWQHVELKRACSSLPAIRAQDRPQDRQAARHSLPAAAQQIIARQPKAARRFVFARQGRRPVSLTKPWRAIRAEADCPGFGLQVCAIRLATLLAVGGAQAAEIMTSLGHRQMSTTTRYLHFADMPAPPWPARRGPCVGGHGRCR